MEGLAALGPQKHCKIQVGSALGASGDFSAPVRVRVCFAEQKLASRTPRAALLREPCGYSGLITPQGAGPQGGRGAADLLIEDAMRRGTAAHLYEACSGKSRDALLEASRLAF